MRKELYEERKHNFGNRAAYRSRDYVCIVYLTGNVADDHATVIGRATKGSCGPEEANHYPGGKSEYVRSAASGAPHACAVTALR